MMLKNLQVGNAPQVSLDVLLSAPSAQVCVNRNSVQCMDFCWQQLRDQHFCRLSSVLPLASSQRTASTKKSGIFLCKYTVLLWNESSLFLFSLLKSFFFSSWRMCCSFTWNEACTKLSFFLGFFGSYSFKNDCSGDWGAALKECCCLFLWRQLPLRVLKVFFQSLLLTRDAENTEPAKFRFSCAVFHSVTRGREHSLCPPVPVPGCFSPGMKVWVWIPGQTLQARGGFFII